MREKLASRFGFLMVAAGCAVGLGNVWRFPFVVGQNGGAAFVLVYLLFLVVLGFPLLLVEFAIGRAAQTGVASAMAALAHPGGARRVWGLAGKIVFAGNFVLMIYYTDVAGWLVKYAGDYLRGTADAADPSGAFARLVANRPTCAAYMVGVVAAAAFVCRLGVAKGVERVTKVLMVSLFALLGFLAVRALLLPGAAEGVRFYLRPDWAKFMLHPWRGVMEAMGQAFFTLSVGVGCMTIFGSYIGREHSLARDAAAVIALDTAVALLSGLVIFPVCRSCGVEPSSGPGLIFIALPGVFAQLAGGRAWGFLFFLFLAFAAFTTVLAVFECLIGGLCDLLKVRRRVVAPLVGVAVAVASLPCVLWDGVLDWEDFALSQLWLPLGSLAMCVFAVTRPGWGWAGFAAETGGLPRVLRWHMAVVIPLLILAVLVGGLVR